MLPFDRFKEFRAPVPSLSTSGDSHVVHYPPRDEVQSRYTLQIDLTATDYDDAYERSNGIASKLLTSLTLIVPGGRYHAELRSVRGLNDKQEYSAFSQTMRISTLGEPENLENIEIDKTLILMKAIDNDPTAENAYVHLLSAWQLQSTPGSRPLERSILQHYVLCIEAIVNGTKKRIKGTKSDQIRAKEREFASEFAKELPNRADKPKAIRDASTKLREISLSNMLPSITEVASRLRLSESETFDAKELYKFRSQYLSHPGRTDKDELRRWLREGPKVHNICVADRVAKAFFRGYCENVLS